MPEISFTKRRILKTWTRECNSLKYLIPLARTQFDILTLGFQMIGRMKPLLEIGFQEDHPNKHPHMANLTEWMICNGWKDMASEFQSFFDQVDEYMKEAVR